MEFFLSQLQGFGGAFTALITDPITYPYIIISVFLGIVFGALPGLTATLAVTILTGFFGNPTACESFHTSPARFIYRSARYPPAR